MINNPSSYHESYARIELPRGRHPEVDKLANKILSLSVRTDFLADDARREGSYIQTVFYPGPTFSGYTPEMQFAVIDDLLGDLPEGNRRNDSEIPRYGLLVEARKGPYAHHQASIEERLLQKPIEHILIEGAPIDKLLAEEYGAENISNSAPLTIEYGYGEGDDKIDLSNLSSEEVSEAVSGLLISFWIRYRLDFFEPSDERWAELHLDDYERVLHKHGLPIDQTPEQSYDEDEDTDAWIQAVAAAGPPKQIDTSMVGLFEKELAYTPESSPSAEDEELSSHAAWSESLDFATPPDDTYDPNEQEITDWTKEWVEPPKGRRKKQAEGLF